MSLFLDGGRVPGHNLRVHVTSERDSKDMSGGASSTDSTEMGTKAKKLNVSLVIPFSTPSWIEQLNEMQERETDGEAHIYRITHDVANAMKVNHGQFFDDFVVSEQEARQLWEITFTLRERLSVQERKQLREVAEAAERSQESSQSPETIPGDVQLSNFERYLKYFDDQLGEIWGEDNATS